MVISSTEAAAATIWSTTSGRRASEKLGIHSTSWGMGYFPIFDFGFLIYDFRLGSWNYATEQKDGWGF
jgi:hypothetical protein